MTLRRLLDLFCGSGGCSVGFARAGFAVYGVDNVPHPDYPFPIHIGDALDVLRRLLAGERVPFTAPDGTVELLALDDFDVIAGSPPCPRYSAATKATKTAHLHPDLIGPTRELLERTGLPWVLENVEGAAREMPAAVLICAYGLGMPRVEMYGELVGLARHRLFESSEFLISPGCACDDSPKVGIFGHSGSVRVGGRNRAVLKADAARLLGVEWMTDREDIADAIPPAYTTFIGEQILERIGAAA